MEELDLMAQMEEQQYQLEEQLAQIEEQLVQLEEQLKREQLAQLAEGFK